MRRWLQWGLYALLVVLVAGVAAVYAMVVSILAARYGLLPTAALPVVGGASGG